MHLFLSAPPSERSSAFAPAEIVRLFKGRIISKLKKEFERLHRQYWGEIGTHAAATLWAEGYYVGTAGHVSAETNKRYIEESQKK